ncbi:hypothetical protein [Sinorhizobium meliloti]|uniref:hypothetical protein n=1 Tax=Rhizobium meliloti TaxID=382 RepID=UPI003DA1201E
MLISTICCPSTSHGLLPPDQAVPDAKKIRRNRQRQCAGKIALTRELQALVLKISCLPCRASASSTASMQKTASMVINSRHDKALRLNQLLRVDVDLDRVLLRFKRQRSAGSKIVRPSSA